ncbi:MAG TPA: hypothetical protein VIY29_00650 [Ktedonobacteraceae bacterium]
MDGPQGHPSSSGDTHLAPVLLFNTGAIGRSTTSGNCSSNRYFGSVAIKRVQQARSQGNESPDQDRRRAGGGARLVRGRSTTVLISQFPHNQRVSGVTQLLAIRLKKIVTE